MINLLRTSDLAQPASAIKLVCMLPPSNELTALPLFQQFGLSFWVWQTFAYCMHTECLHTNSCSS